MNIVLLTVEERLHMPALFHCVPRERAGDTRVVFTGRLRYGRQSTRRLISKYRAAFRWLNLLRLAWRQAQAGICDMLAIGRSR